jgi:hypothetical protein
VLLEVGVEKDRLTKPVEPHIRDGKLTGKGITAPALSTDIQSRVTGILKRIPLGIGVIAGGKLHLIRGREVQVPPTAEPWSVEGKTDPIIEVSRCGPIPIGICPGGRPPLAYVVAGVVDALTDIAEDGLCLGDDRDTRAEDDSE